MNRNIKFIILLVMIFISFYLLNVVFSTSERISTFEIDNEQLIKDAKYSLNELQDLLDGKSKDEVIGLIGRPSTTGNYPYLTDNNGRTISGFSG